VTLLAAITRGDIADYLATLITVYVVMIIIWILLSWFRLPYNRGLNVFLEFLQDVVLPYLSIFRRFIPMVRLGPGAIDVSPIVGILVLEIAGGLVVSLIRG
jgi:YggT family protein